MQNAKQPPFPRPPVQPNVCSGASRKKQIPSSQSSAGEASQSLAYVSTNGSWNTTSDARLKENVVPADGFLARVKELNVVHYDYKNREAQEHQVLGLLAQEVLPHFPELVSRDDEDGYMGLDYSGFGVVAIRAIQEQQEIIDEQVQQIDDQARNLSAMEERLALLESLLISQSLNVLTTTAADAP